MPDERTMQQRTRRGFSIGRPLVHGCMAAALVAVLLLAGCSQNRFDVTRHETVAEQFQFALEQHQAYHRSPERLTNQKRLGEIGIAAYQKVLDVFPDETKYVNRSRLGIARIQDEEGQDRQALAAYEALIQECPDDDVVQINSMYYAGRILDSRKDFEAAKDYYRTIVDRYSESEDKTFQHLVRISQMEYRKVRER